ncbi:MAG: thioredoxin domain-containing protein [Gammaproteobacteria bacterium]|nr:thioredoxin domain-containing protein [Gammaproteobacteria bacterium]
MTEPEHTNRLIDEISPYLLQHAHNPVDWQPWDQTALAQARREDKPIFVSIGYSACHWCHVMEHESFEDDSVARYLNTHYVNIKVDREERPDLDKIYQTAHQLLTQRAGGWPLSVVLNPADHTPFFAGTYFPKQPRYGMPGFLDVMQRVLEYYREHKDRLADHAAALKDALQEIETPAHSHSTVDASALSQAVRELIRQYDRTHGGFGSAPKFPHPTNLELCLRAWGRQDDSSPSQPRALHVARHTFEAMAHGGVYDQLGGGFCRYSVDERWSIPHFEKMLYDNAQLLPLYADVWCVTGDRLFRRVAEETGAWVIREMQSPTGGYYSTLDADSEGKEGKFYAWHSDEIEAILSDTEWPIVAAVYGLKGAPNFEGKWHLNVHQPVSSAAERLGIPSSEAETALHSARAKLYQVRSRRVWPTRDEKILTSWNGLMIKGMGHAGRVMRREDFTQSASSALEFLRDSVWRDGQLFAATKDGKTHLNAYLDDHVYLIDGILELLQCRWKTADLEFAIELAERVLNRFRDEEHGGFYFTSDDHETLILRHKPTTDDDTPSGNGIAARVLLRLGHLLGEQRYLDAARATLETMAASIKRFPSAHGALLIAQEEYLHPTQTVVLRGAVDSIEAWIDATQAHYAPGRLSVAIPDEAVSLPGLLAARSAGDDVIAYVCEGHRCRAPINDFAEFRQHMDNTVTRELPPQMENP